MQKFPLKHARRSHYSERWDKLASLQSNGQAKFDSDFGEETKDSFTKDPVSLTLEAVPVWQPCDDVDNVKERQAEKDADKGANFGKERDEAVGPILFFYVDQIVKEEYLPKKVVT